MTGASDLLAFTSALKDLAAAYRKTVDEPTTESFYEGLADLPLAQVEQAMAAAKKASRFMPSVAVIRSFADHVADTTRASTSRPQLKPGEDWCSLCSDTGFAYVDAAGRMVSVKTAVATGLRLVRRCPCRPENPNYQWAREQERPRRSTREAR